MTARDAILVPAGVGDEVVHEALRYARHTANFLRRHRLAGGSVALYPLQDTAITAEVYLGADRDRTMAARNEIRFLLGPYLTAPGRRGS
ncbi:MAG: hypothetical protein KF822_09615 [Steroidobacteraceae bacterium]|nr:hypothetical protein [Steroidobacteraceae bacterium]